MILLQATFSNDDFYLFEVIIVVFVIILQISHSFRLYGNIIKLRTIFIERFTIKNGYIEKSKIGKSEDVMSSVLYDDNDTESFNSIIDEDIIKITLVQTARDNEVISRIKQTLNSYLINNYGAAVNFSIIKDIIDREVDVKDEEISQSIPTPLYLGLAATMIGIIFGLLAMPKLNGNGFSDGINALIDGVKLAMTASLTGLLCTTLLSSYFYKRAKRVVLRDKNDQLSYLQAKLLPELVRAEDTGVSGLKASLDRFAREATKISDNVKIAANQTGLNLHAQLDVISKVENLNMTKVSRINLELFDRLEENMSAFNQFSRYLTQMNKISDNLLNFSSKTENIDKIAYEINNTLNKSQEVLNFLQTHSKSLTTHIEQILDSGGAARNAVNLADSHFRDAIEILSNEINARLSALNVLSDNTESTIKETFNTIGNRLNEITEKHINSLITAYNDSVPHFEQLNNLKLLPELRDKSTIQSKDLIDALNQLNRSLSNISNRIDNQSVLTKLDAIEKSLKRRTNTTVKEPNEKPLKTGFFKKLKNRFSRKNKLADDHEEQ